MNYTTFIMLFGLTIVYMINYIDTQVTGNWARLKWCTSVQRITARRRKSPGQERHHYHHHPQVTAS